MSPEDNKPNWHQENVKEGPPKVGIVLDHGNVGKVPFVLNGNLEKNVDPETVIEVIWSYVNIVHSVIAVRGTCSLLCIGVIFSICRIIKPATERSTIHRITSC